MDSFGLSLIRKRKKQQMELFISIIIAMNIAVMMHMMLSMMCITIHTLQPLQDKKIRRHQRLQNLNKLILENDVGCKNELRVNMKTFWVLCEMLRDVRGLSGTRNMTLEEIVAMFLYTLAHHRKNRTIGGYFLRSGESISRHFNRCLLAVLKLRHHLIKNPQQINEDCEDERWKLFKNCLGALDGTFISVHVSNEVKGKYRTRKGHIAMNVLGACTPDMEFTYVLPGWEGSAHDGRVLNSALSRPNGLKIPQGSYYLVDAGYSNCEEFLSP